MQKLYALAFGRTGKVRKTDLTSEIRGGLFNPIGKNGRGGLYIQNMQCDHRATKDVVSGRREAVAAPNYFRNLDGYYGAVRSRRLIYPLPKCRQTCGQF